MMQRNKAGVAVPWGLLLLLTILFLLLFSLVLFFLTLSSKDPEG